MLHENSSFPSWDGTWHKIFPRVVAGEYNSSCFLNNLAKGKQEAWRIPECKRGKIGERKGGSKAKRENSSKFMTHQTGMRVLRVQMVFL